MPELRNGKKHLVCYLGEMCPQDGVDEVVTEVAMRAAVSAGLNARRQSVFHNLQATPDSFGVAILAGPVALKYFVKSAVFASNATRFEANTAESSSFHHPLLRTGAHNSRELSYSTHR